MFPVGPGVLQSWLLDSAACHRCHAFSAVESTSRTGEIILEPKRSQKLYPKAALSVRHVNQKRTNERTTRAPEARLQDLLPLFHFDRQHGNDP